MSSDARLVDVIDRRFGAPNAPKRIGIAVSGGSDSLALLHAFADWGKADDLRASARLVPADIAAGDRDTHSSTSASADSHSAASSARVPT